MSKVVLITGASSGLGEATAFFLKQNGYRVYGTSRRGADAGKPFPMLSMDVREATSVQKAVQAVIDKEGRIDALINNAGIGIAGPIEELQFSNIKQVFETNVYGPIRICQAVLPHMRNTGGRIINISSIGAVFGLPYRGIYCASKASVDIISETLRMELYGKNVQICSVRAGDIQTDINAHRIKDYQVNGPYANSFTAVYELIDKDVDQGMPVEVVAQKIARLIEVRRLRRYYTIGKPIQKLSIILKRILPGRWFEWVIRFYSGE